MIRAAHRCALLIAAFACVLCGTLHAAEVRAWLDRNSMQLGETVTLNVEVSGDTRVPQPDFSALSQDFDLLGTQSSSSMNIVNGQTSTKLLWAVGLQPKRAGTLTIPALDVAGQKTSALTLNVQQGAASSSAKAGDDVYIEVSADPRAPYVQQQIRLTVKLYFALNFSDGGLEDPQGDGLVVHKLGQDTYYAADVGGRRYRVWERRYAVVPEKSGNLTVPSIAFRGHAIDPADVNSFFSRGRAVTARSEAISFDVRPRPAASGTEAWLPARSITLTADGIADHASARVGEPLTLTLHLRAQGLGFEQLPDLKLPKVDGADIYPDKSSTQNHDDGEWLYGERERKFAIVPNRPGPLVLPAVSLGWWDTAHDRAANAEAPSLTLDVQPVAGTPTGSASAINPASTPTPPVQQETKTGRTGSVAEASAGDPQAARWRTIAIAALLLWVVTVLAGGGWWLARRRRGQALTPAPSANGASQSALRAAFLSAARQADWPGSARALLAWARHSKPQVRNLGELAQLISDSSQAAAVRALDRACYGGGDERGNLAVRIAESFSGSLALASDQHARQDGVVPPLYPAHR